MTDIKPTIPAEGQQNESAIEEGDTHTTNSVHSRIRANSTIMKAKKILGTYYNLNNSCSHFPPSSRPSCWESLLTSPLHMQLPTVVKSPFESSVPPTSSPCKRWQSSAMRIAYQCTDRRPMRPT